MKFDHYAVVLLMPRPDAPQQDEEAAAALRDARMHHLASLHEAGHLVAAGPFTGGDDQNFRGLCILNVDADTARELCEQDPAIIAGRCLVKISPRVLSAGAVSFSPTRFPQSVAEAVGDSLPPCLAQGVVR